MNTIIDIYNSAPIIIYHFLFSIIMSVLTCRPLFKRQLASAQLNNRSNFLQTDATIVSCSVEKLDSSVRVNSAIGKRPLYQYYFPNITYMYEVDANPFYGSSKNSLEHLAEEWFDFFDPLSLRRMAFRSKGRGGSRLVPSTSNALDKYSDEEEAKEAALSFRSGQKITVYYNRIEPNLSYIDKRSFPKIWEIWLPLIFIFCIVFSIFYVASLILVLLLFFKRV